MRIIAFDFGEKRIGVAISDALNMIAQGIDVMERKGLKEDIERIKLLLKEYNVGKIILGLPLNMDGTKGKGAEEVIKFAEAFKGEISIDVELVDERLTTAQGERMLLEADVSRKKRRRCIDKIAAQLILQAYLDSHVQKNRPQ